MRKLLAVLFTLFFLAGCNYTPEERLTALREAKQPVVSVVEAADFTIESLIREISVAEELLGDPELDSKSVEKLLTAIGNAKAKMEQITKYKQPFLDQVNQIDKAIADIIERGDVTLADEIGVYIPAARVVTSKLPPPYNVYAELGILLITTGIGIFGGLKTQKVLDTKEILQTKQEAEKTGQTLSGVVKSVSAALKKVPEDNKGEVLAALKESQEDSGVRGEVVKLLN